jgi:DUF4097 and DUF4098 domain-containing protein YvlB
VRIRIDVLAATLLAAAMPLQAQVSWQRGDQSWCEDDRNARNSESYCEVLTATVGSTGSLEVDGGANGGIHVVSWDGDQVEVTARVSARAPSAERAEEIARAVEVGVEDGRIQADGPRTERRESWSVSYELRVPRNTDLDLATVNGGIDVSGVSGDIAFRATNGGVSLVDLAGDVHGRTTNGGLHVELAGERWDGSGMDVQTTNGGITMRVPGDYSAELVARTLNGGIDVDFPVTVQGRIGRQVEATLGNGGPTIRAVTTNGGVHIARL